MNKFKVIKGEFSQAQCDTKNLRGASMAIDSLIRLAKFQEMSGTEAAIMISDFLEAYDVKVPESFVSKKVVEKYNPINKYSNILDGLESFTSQMCSKADEYCMPGKALYDAYRSHCKTTKHFPVTSGDFAAHLRRKGYEKNKTREGNFWNIILKEDS